MDNFIKNLPKIELHAHLNGSLCTKSIVELGQQVYGETNEQFLDMTRKFTQLSGDKLDDCFRKFAFMRELTSTKKGLLLAAEMVIRDFALDNVVYLELRTTPKKNECMNRREYLDIIIAAIESMSNKYKVIVKLLVSIDRSQSIQVAEEILDLAIKLKDQHPHIVKGMDLSGNPKMGIFNDFVSILGRAKNEGLKLALHCAEVVNESETQEMLDFDFERCGHGTFLTELQLVQCRSQNITIECCLTSNIKCGTVKSYYTHHFGTALENNVKTVLCTDDSGVFNTTLSKEFAIASNVFRFSKSMVYELCINAVDASFADTNEKNELRLKLDMYFKEDY